jgi:MFS transporter, ACS family, D-galactonate transporter
VRRPVLRERPRWVGVVVLMLCQSSQALVIGGVALFLPLIRSDLGITFTQAGALDAVSTLTYAFMQIPAGVLADRFGPRRLFLIGLVGVDVLALSFALQHDYHVLLANQALSGFFRSLVFAPGLLLMASRFPTDRRATALGLYVAGGFSSNIFLNLLGPLLVGPLGWRGLFAVFSGLGVLALVAFWRISARWEDRERPPHVPLREALGVLRHGAMWAIAGIQYIRLAIVFGLGVWLPTFIVSDRGYSLQVAGAVVALSAAVTAPSNFLGGYLSDRLRRPLVIIGGSLGAMALTIFLLPRVHGIVPLIAVIAVTAIFVQLYFGPLFAVPVEMYGLRTAGLISGFGNFFANLGGFTFVYTLGAIKDATGSFEAGFDALAGACLVGVALSVLLARLRRRAAATAVP